MRLVLHGQVMTSAPLRGGRRVLLAALAALAAASLPTATAHAQTADGDPTPQARLAHAEFLAHTPPPAAGAGTICVVDTGVTDLRDTVGQVVERIAVDGGRTDDVFHSPADALTGHGTFVAGLIASRVDGWGSAGFWPQAKIVSVRVLPEPGRGTASASDYGNALLECMQASRAVHVINLSLSGLSADESELARLQSRVDALRELGISVVAAVGNSGGMVGYPARLDGVLGVGASDTGGALCELSARGAGLDLTALGCRPHGSLADGRVAAFQGTSFAAPLVSATLAALRAHAPALTAAQAERLVLETAGQGPGGPMLDAAAAFRAVGLGRLVDEHTPWPATLRPPPTLVAPDGAEGTFEAAGPTDGVVARPPAATPAHEPPTPRSSGRSPARPTLRSLGLRRGRLRVEVRGLPTGGLLRFRVDGRTYLRRTTRLTLRIRRWHEIAVIAQDARGQRSQPLRLFRR